MIRLENLTKSYRTKQGRHYVFKDLNADFPEDSNIALIGKNGAGKSTLMQILGGIDHPDTGRVLTNKNISWPLGLASGFQGSLTGRDNAKFVCRCYGREEDIPEKLAFIEEFSEIGKYFFEPVKSYSSGMRSKLAFAMSMAFEFDTYLVDEITAVGDKQFREKSERTFQELKDRANIIMVAHNPNMLKANCDAGIVLHEGNATVFDTVDDALNFYNKEVNS